MDRFGRRLSALLALCCAAAAGPGAADLLDRQDLLMHADIATEPCPLTDPSDPHQIVGPNPAHGQCIAALHSAAILLDRSTGSTGSSGAVASRSDGAASASEPTASASLGSVSLILAAIAMLVLAGFNSRKRRQLPEPGLGDRYAGQPRLHKHSESSGWNED